MDEVLLRASRNDVLGIIVIAARHSPIGHRAPAVRPGESGGIGERSVPWNGKN
jgi:hypothetical protein